MRRQGAKSRGWSGDLPVSAVRQALEEDVESDVESDGEDGVRRAEPSAKAARAAEEREETADEARLRVARAMVETMERSVGARFSGPDARAAVSRALASEAQRQSVSGPLRVIAEGVGGASASEWAARVHRVRGPRACVTSVCVSDDGQRAWTGQKDGSVMEWELQEGRTVGRQLVAGAAKAASGGAASGAAAKAAEEGWGVFAASDGISKAVRAEAALAGRKRLRDDGGAAAPAAGHVGAVTCVACSGSGKWVVTGGEDWTVRVWESGSGRPAHVLRGHRKRVTGAAFRWGSEQLYTVSEDRTLKVWEAGSGLYVDTVPLHRTGVLDVSVRRRERAVSVGGRDRVVMAASIKTERALKLVAPADCGSLDCVTAVDDRFCVAGAASGALYLFSAEKSHPVATVPHAHGPGMGIAALATVPGSDLLFSGAGDGMLRLWRVRIAAGARGRGIDPVAQLPVPGFVNAIACAHNGSRVVCAVAREPRLGRWASVRRARDALLRIDLPPLAAIDHDPDLHDQKPQHDDDDKEGHGQAGQGHKDEGEEEDGGAEEGQEEEEEDGDEEEDGKDEDEEEDEEDGKEEEKEEKDVGPDFESMTVVQLRQECQKRNLSTKGLKAELLQRLEEAQES